MDSSISPKDEIWFLRVCHHIATGLYHYFTATMIRREHFYAIRRRSAVCLLSVWKSEVVSLMAVRSAKRKLPGRLSRAVQSAKCKVSGISLIPVLLLNYASFEGLCCEGKIYHHLGLSADTESRFRILQRWNSIHESNLPTSEGQNWCLWYCHDVCLCVFVCLFTRCNHRFFLWKVVITLYPWGTLHVQHELLDSSNR